MSDERDLNALIREALPNHSAPHALREWARERAREAPVALRALGPNDVVAPPRPGSRLMRRMLYAAGLVAAAALGWTGQHLAHAGDGANRDRDVLIRQLVDTHVRSLMSDHLTDVQSTDQHTVKPWFAGKTDFAPRVVDLASEGFPLVGGRLDYVQGHDAATLVYGRRKHAINLFMWPMSAGEREEASDAPATYHGFALRHWLAGGMHYWAVSDAAPSELAAFQQAHTAAH